MARGHADYMKDVGQSAEGEFLPILAIPPVWWGTDFEAGVHNFLVTGGTATLLTGGYVDTDAPGAFSGAGYLRLLTPVAGIGIISQLIGWGISSKICGIECWFCLKDKTKFTADYLGVVPINLLWFDGTNLNVISLAYNSTNNKFAIVTGAGAEYSEVATVNLLQASWHYVKVVFDITNSIYKKVYIDGLSYDVSSVAIAQSAAVTGIRLFIGISAKGAAAQQGTIFVDRMRLTYNEV